MPGVVPSGQTNHIETAGCVDPVTLQVMRRGANQSTSLTGRDALGGTAVSAGRATANLDERQFIAIAHDQIEFTHLATVIAHYQAQPLLFQMMQGQRFAILAAFRGIRRHLSVHFGFRPQCRIEFASARVRMQLESGTLYVVATPIGNLGDLSPRALAVLGAVDWVAAEDTRHSGRLLQHFGINTPLLSLHEHNERERVPQLLDELRAGRTGALISDAGTPLVSDPGFPLVRELRRQALPVRAVPGPSSVLAALSIAGLPCERFAFEGFLPAKPAARRERIRQLADSPWTLVLFEAGRRVRDALADLIMLFGAERPAFIGRELTKAFEESHTASLGELDDWLADRPERERGEFVLVVQGAPIRDPQREQVLRVLRPLLRELPLKQAVALAAELTDERRNTLYELALEEQRNHQ